MRLEAAPGATPEEFSGTLLSDVTTNGSIFNDFANVEFALVMKDQGNPASPAPLNAVTITRYRVVYRRTDGRNTPGVDVPFGFDSGVTVTVSADGGITDFELVRHSAKQEPPLRFLQVNADIISTIAEVTFYGHDQAGNELSATGLIGVDFGNFADPE